MKIYILGICGTFMAGIAMLAHELGYQVVGSDAIRRSRPSWSKTCPTSPGHSGYTSIY